MHGQKCSWVSRDLSRNHGIIKLGVIGKLIVFGGLTWTALSGQVHPVLMVPGIVDLVFCILYIGFLRTVARAGGAP